MLRRTLTEHPQATRETQHDPPSLASARSNAGPSAPPALQPLPASSTASTERNTSAPFDAEGCFARCLRHCCTHEAKVW